MATDNLHWNILIVNVIALISCDLIVLCADHNSDMYNHRVLHYNFESMTSRQVFDVSGNGKTAKMSDEDIQKREGKCGSGILFNSRPLQITIPVSRTHKVLSKLEITVAAWIYLNKVESKRYRTILASFREGATKPFWKFDLSKVNGFDMLRWSTNSTSKFRPNSNFSHLKLGQWVHVAASYTFTDGNETCYFFVNGSLYESKNAGKSLNKFITLSHPPPLGYLFRIGSNNNYGAFSLNGIMDELSIFNKSLTAKEIQKLVNDTCEELPTPQPNVTSTKQATTVDTIKVTSTKQATTVDTIKVTSTKQATTVDTIKVTSTKNATTINTTKKTKAEAENYLSKRVDELVVKFNTSKQKDERNSQMKATKELENNTLSLERQKLKVNDSRIFNTSIALIQMTIPLSGFVFPPEDWQQGNYANATISFPDDMVQTTDNTTVRRAFVCIAYSELHETMSGELTASFSPNKLKLNSKIIGAAVDPPLDKPLSTPITITFTHAEIPSGQRVFCSFWKHSTREDDGEWSTRGCELNKKNSTSTVCSCNHLTNFALLREVTSTKNATTINTTKKTKAEAENYLSNRVDELVGKVSGKVGNSQMEATEEFEKNTLSLARQMLKVNDSRSFNSSIALIFITIPLSGFVFPPEDQQQGNDVDTTISFPDDMVQTTDKVQRAFVCIAYSKLHETLNSGELTASSSSFTPKTKLEMNSKIIGAAVDPPLDKALSTPITITFTHAEISSGQQVCSFWNHSIRNVNGSYGGWSTKGCELDEENSTPTKTVCLCNHLTNFALLLQREGEPYRAPPLSLEIITIIGCTLSILACVLCFVMFFTLKKKDIRHHLHINLTFAIAVAQLILLCGITQTEYEILCKIMAACLHYFYMVAFLLMLCEGVHLAILIETAFLHGELKLPVYLIASWGLPLIIVGITLGARYDNYGGSIACFISADEGTIYAFVGPFALILLINFVILIIVLRQVIRKTSLPISSKSASKFEIARATVRSLAILFPVMGFTWIFGILFFGFRTLALQYLFAIFCSLQGFFIFLFQYALNTENRQAFVRATRRWRLTFASSTSSSGNGLKQTGSTKTKDNAFDERAETEKATSNAENCHLMVYRTVDETGGTLDSRTISTLI